MWSSLPPVTATNIGADMPPITSAGTAATTTALFAERSRDRAAGATHANSIDAPPPIQRMEGAADAAACNGGLAARSGRPSLSAPRQSLLPSPFTTGADTCDASPQPTSVVSPAAASDAAAVASPYAASAHPPPQELQTVPAFSSVLAAGTSDTARPHRARGVGLTREGADLSRATGPTGETPLSGFPPFSSPQPAPRERSAPTSGGTGRRSNAEDGEVNPLGGHRARGEGPSRDGNVAAPGCQDATHTSAHSLQSSLVSSHGGSSANEECSPQPQGRRRTPGAVRRARIGATLPFLTASLTSPPASSRSASRASPPQWQPRQAQSDGCRGHRRGGRSNSSSGSSSRDIAAPVPRENAAAVTETCEPSLRSSFRTTEGEALSSALPMPPTHLVGNGVSVLSQHTTAPSVRPVQGELNSMPSAASAASAAAAEPVAPPADADFDPAASMNGLLEMVGDRSSAATVPPCIRREGGRTAILSVACTAPQPQAAHADPSSEQLGGSARQTLPMPLIPGASGPSLPSARESDVLEMGGWASADAPASAQDVGDIHRLCFYQNNSSMARSFLFPEGLAGALATSDTALLPEDANVVDSGSMGSPGLPRTLCRPDGQFLTSAQEENWFEVQERGPGGVGGETASRSQAPVLAPAPLLPRTPVQPLLPSPSLSRLSVAMTSTNHITPAATAASFRRGNAPPDNANVFSAGWQSPSGASLASVDTFQSSRLHPAMDEGFALSHARPPLPGQLISPPPFQHQQPQQMHRHRHATPLTMGQGGGTRTATRTPPLFHRTRTPPSAGECLNTARHSGEQPLPHPHPASGRAVTTGGGDVPDTTSLVGCVRAAATPAASFSSPTLATHFFEEKRATSTTAPGGFPSSLQPPPPPTNRASARNLRARANSGSTHKSDDTDASGFISAASVSVLGATSRKSSRALSYQTAHTHASFAVTAKPRSFSRGERIVPPGGTNIYTYADVAAAAAQGSSDANEDSTALFTPLADQQPSQDDSFTSAAEYPYRSPSPGLVHTRSPQQSSDGTSVSAPLPASAPSPAAAGAGAARPVASQAPPPKALVEFQKQFQDYTQLKSQCTEAYLTRIERTVDSFLTRFYNPRSEQGNLLIGSAGGGAAAAGGVGRGSAAFINKAGAKLTHWFKQAAANINGTSSASAPLTASNNAASVISGNGRAALPPSLPPPPQKAPTPTDPLPSAAPLPGGQLSWAVPRQSPGVVADGRGGPLERGPSAMHRNSNSIGGGGTPLGTASPNPSIIATTTTSNTAITAATAGPAGDRQTSAPTLSFLGSTTTAGAERGSQMPTPLSPAVAGPTRPSSGYGSPNMPADPAGFTFPPSSPPSPSAGPPAQAAAQAAPAPPWYPMCPLHFTDNAIPDNYIDQRPSEGVLRQVELNYPIILHALKHLLPPPPDTTAPTSLASVAAEKIQQASVSCSHAAASPPPAGGAASQTSHSHCSPGRMAHDGALAKAGTAAAPSDPDKTERPQQPKSAPPPTARELALAMMANPSVTIPYSLQDHAAICNELIVPTIEAIWREYLEPLEACLQEHIAKANTLMRSMLLLDTAGSASHSTSPTPASAPLLTAQQHQQCLRMFKSLQSDAEYIVTISQMDKEFVREFRREQEALEAARVQRTEEGAASPARGARLVPEDNQRKSFVSNLRGAAAGAMSDYVPVYGLIMSRLHRLEMEHRTVLELWDPAVKVGKR